MPDSGICPPIPLPLDGTVWAVAGHIIRVDTEPCAASPGGQLSAVCPSVSSGHPWCSAGAQSARLAAQTIGSSGLSVPSPCRRPHRRGHLRRGRVRSCVDALAHAGPANRRRVSPAVCGQATMPGTTLPRALPEAARPTASASRVASPTRARRRPSRRSRVTPAADAGTLRRNGRHAAGTDPRRST
jgi:hypothetical protein